MQLCPDHGAKEHNMKGFGPDLYRKMRGCVKTLEEANIRADDLKGLGPRGDRHPQSLPASHPRAIPPLGRQPENEAWPGFGNRLPECNHSA